MDFSFFFIYNTINLISNFYRKEEAIDCLDLRVNYDEMIKDAITLSKTLKELGIKKGSIVSAAMPNYYQGVIIYLACNRIGAITTFINSMSSIEEVLGYLNEFESSLFINFDKDKEYKLIYINGDHNIPSPFIKIDGEEKQLKVRSIEQTFLKNMFEE